VVSAVKELGLQTQVQQDTLRDVIAAQNKKIERSNLVTVGALLIPEAFRTFGEPDNALVRAGILAAPLLLAPRGQSRSGLDGVIRHPAFYGGAGLLALAFIGDQRKRNSSVQAINVLGPAQLTANKDDVFIADVLDARGKQSTITPTWQSDNPAVAEIDAATGRVRARAPGVAIISASAGDVVRRIRLEIVAASGTK
jgi:Bacterial Ig-like domain (group 2)